MRLSALDIHGSALIIGGEGDAHIADAIRAARTAYREDEQ
jgi:hypothetical protein